MDKNSLTHICNYSNIQGVPEKNTIKGFLGKTRQFFSKLFLNSKMSCISTSFKKRISILSHIGKKLQARQFLQNHLSEKAHGSKKLSQFFFFFLIFSNTVLVIDLTFKFEFLGQKMINLCTFYCTFPPKI